ncbi:GTD-binding domain [Sesbania bispinosa]|nr:GTD-binding domain [Sesbania bispinosa]
MAFESFTRFVEQLGKFPHFVMCMVLEWVLIIVIFLDGFLAFFAIEFAKFFEMEIPCWFCARMNHVLAYKAPNFYYNNSICEGHKKYVSSLAFCHNHKKFSEIRKMCEGCLLSFATEKESDCDTYRSLVGVLNKNMECYVENGQNVQLSLKDDGAMQVEKSSTLKCSCCGAPLKVKSSFSKWKNSGSFSRTPIASPRAYPCMTPKNEESQDSKLKFMSKNDSELPQNQNIKSREEAKGASLPLLTEAEDLNTESPKTPSSPWGNRFFGIPLIDSPNNSPRGSCGISKKSPLEKTEFASDSNEGNSQNEADDAILNNLKRQVHLDRKSLMALYVELDEERTASTVAANNAMAMITRLQEEKAALQMDAFQYQRMMEEQLEYDEEALQATNDMLLKEEEEVKTLESELEIYRDKFGCLTENDFNEHSSHGGNTSPHRPIEGEDSVEKYLNLHQAVSSKSDNVGAKFNDSIKDFRMEKTYLLGQMKETKNRTLLAESGI